MSKKTTLFLDIGEVFLTNGWDRNSRKLAAQTFHLDEESFQERHQLAAGSYERGNISLETYLEHVIFYEPRSFSHHDFKDFIFDQSKPYPEMIAMIKEIKKQYGLKTVVVSNEGREIADHRVKNFNLTEFIDIFVISGYVSFRKPDTKFFQLALDLSQAAPEEILYLDDRKFFLEVASGLGIEGVHIDAKQPNREFIISKIQ